MKIIKLILKIIGGVIGTVVLILFLDYLRINIHYLIHKDDYQDTFKVQGNKDNYIPQSITYSDKYDLVIQTSYNSKHKVSRIYLTKFSTGEFLKELDLKDENNNDYIKHVGGISNDNNTVWITSDYEVCELNMEELVNNDNTTCKITKLPIRGDFVTYNNGILWIGDFFLKPFYYVPNDDPLLLGYDYNQEIDYNKPNYVVSLPKMVQSLVITKDNKFMFTRSFTNLVKTRLSIYSNPLDNKIGTYNINGNEIDYYKLELEKEIKIMPMGEGMIIKDNELYIIFETSSDSYWFTYPKMPYIVKYKLKDKI